MSAFSAQAKTLAIVPKITGGLSMLGSSYIFQDVVRTHKKRGNSVYHRILMGLSVFDFMASLMNFFSTWPIPKNTYPPVYGAIGTVGTCTAAGFFNEVGNVCTPIYNASLCIYYVLIIINSWGESRIARYELWFHIVPNFFAWTIGFVALGFQTYNNAGWNCWLASYPKGCNAELGQCTRGEHVFIFRWLHYAIIWSAVSVVTIAMIVIYASVYIQEKSTARFTDHQRASVNPKHANQNDKKDSISPSGVSSAAGSNATAYKRASKSRKVMEQAFFFCIAMYLTWIFTTVTRLIQVAGGQPPFPLMVFQVIFFPMQGVFNFLTYLRPRYLRTKAKHPNISTCEFLRQVLAPTTQVREKSQRPTSERRSSLFQRSLQYIRGSRHGSEGRQSASLYGGSDGNIEADEPEQAARNQEEFKNGISHKVDQTQEESKKPSSTVDVKQEDYVPNKGIIFSPENGDPHSQEDLEKQGEAEVKEEDGDEVY